MPFSAFFNNIRSQAPYQNRLNRDPFVSKLAEEKSPKSEPKAKKAKLVDPASKVEQAEYTEPPEDKMYIDYLQNNGYLNTLLVSDPSMYLDNPIHPIFYISNFDNTHTSTTLTHSHMTPALQLASIWLTKPELLH